MQRDDRSGGPTAGARLPGRVHTPASVVVVAVTVAVSVGCAPASPVGTTVPAPRATPGDGASRVQGAPSFTPQEVPTGPVPDLVVVPPSGSGVLVAATVPEGPAPDGADVVTYSVEVEGGLPLAPDGAAAEVRRVLHDPRGWQTLNGIRFVAVPPEADPMVPVVVVSPDLVDALCAPLDTGGEVSCFNGSTAVLNARRWVSGAPTYGTDLVGYRTYLVNHEVGHGLDNRHEGCPAPGGPAPVMVQQTLGLDGCTAWPWPTLP